MATAVAGLLRALPAIVAPGAVIFAYPMLSLIGSNREYFGDRYAAGAYVFAAGAAFVALGTALYLARRRTATLLVAYLLTAPAWFGYTLLRPATGAVAAALAAVAALLVATVVLRRRPLASVVAPLSGAGGILLVVLGASTVFALRAGDASAATPTGADVADTAAGAANSDLPNVYHVLLDEFQTEMFEANLRPRVREALAGFTYYPEATTPFGRTELAVASMFAGEDYAYDVAPADYAAAALHGPESSLQRLRDAGYHTTGYIHTLSQYTRRSPFDQLYLHRDVAASGTLPGYAGLATSLWAYAALPEPVAARVIPARYFDQLTGAGLLPDDAPLLSVRSFRAFLQREPTLAASGRYTLVHLIHPHFPTVLERDCTTTPGRETGPVEQADCALLLVEEFLATLRRLGRFDDAMIVVHADHGSRYRATGDGLVEVQSAGVYSEAFSRARSRPLLLVKPPGAPAGGELAVSRRPATTDDVLATIFDGVGLPLRAAGDRASLLAADFPRRPTRYYHFYDKDRRTIVRGPLQRFAIRGDVVTFDRTIPVPEAE